MAEWLIEEGIGETRAILVDNGHLRAARLFLPDPIRAGLVCDATLSVRHSGSRRGTVVLPNGAEALVDGLAPEASRGAPLRVEVTRAAIQEGTRSKRTQVRPTKAACTPAPSPQASLRKDGLRVRTVSRFPDDPWPELLGEALDGIVAFEGGSLIVSPTPAMTLIDVDGSLPPAALARAAVPAIADSIRRFDLGGSIGIDFPTLEKKDDRRAVDTALAHHLEDWPHQSTAMNGFGFVQLIARSLGPSLLHQVRLDPAATGARLLLRRAEDVHEAGVLLLSASPAVRAAMKPEWEEQLARRTGRSLRWSVEPGLALGAGFAQAVSS